MEKKRLYYIDWLRVLVILSLIPFHAALSYLRFGVVYIKAPVIGPSAWPFLLVTVPLGDFFMTLLFFVSGVASFHSLALRGSGRYIGERLNKLMQPLLLGFLFLCPETGYLMALHEGYQGGFLHFLPQFFYFQLLHYLGYGHLWFLLYLFVFSMVCLPLFQRWQREEGRLARIGDFITRGNRMLLPIGAVVLFELLLRPFFDGKQTIIGDWANDAVYGSVFLFGYLYAADARIEQRLRGYFKPSVVFGLLGLAGLFWAEVEWQVFGSSALYLSVVRAFCKGIYECSAIIFLMVVGKNRLNRGGRAIGYLSRASFPIYILHYLPVSFFTLLFLGLPVPNFVKFLLVVALSYLAVFLAYEVWRRASGRVREFAAKRRTVGEPRTIPLDKTPYHK